MAELLPNWLQENCYPAQYDRLMLGNVVCSEGVADVGGGSLLVTTGGAGLDLSVAQGGGWVEGDDDDRGFYSIYNDAPVELTATAANPTNPRIDQVIARVYDSTYGEGADEWVLEMLDGTPTAGATLANLNGADTLPDNAITLAYILVPATFLGPFVDATHILDARTPYGSCETFTDYDAVWTNAGTLDASSSHRFIRNGDQVTVSFLARFDGGGSASQLEMSVPLPISLSDAETLGTAVYRVETSSGRTYYGVSREPAGDSVVFYKLDGSTTTPEVGPTLVDDFMSGTFSYAIAP